MRPVALREVLHVPGLDKNLLSVPRLTEKGLAVQMLHKCVIKGTYGTVFTVNKSGAFYMMDCMAVTVPEPTSEIKKKCAP
jgi:hypothetical protein